MKNKTLYLTLKNKDSRCLWKTMHANVIKCLVYQGTGGYIFNSKMLTIQKQGPDSVKLNRINEEVVTRFLE